MSLFNTNKNNNKKKGNTTGKPAQPTTKGKSTSKPAAKTPRVTGRAQRGS